MLSLQYPCCVMPSTFGHIPLTPPELVPYLVPSSDSNSNVSNTINVNSISTVCLQVEIDDITNKSFGSLPLSSLSKDTTAGIIKKIKILSGRNMNTLITSYCSKGIKIQSNKGVKTVTINDYIDKITSNINNDNDNDNIQIVLPLAEEIPLLLDLSTKRIYKANERTKSWFNELKNTASINWDKIALFGIAIPIPSDYKTTSDGDDKESDLIKRIIASCISLISSGVKGIVIGGAFQGEPLEYLCRVISSVKSAINDMKLPNYVPIMIQGADTIPSVLKVIEAGADLVSGRLTMLLSKKGRALRWKKGLDDDNDINTITSSSTITTINSTNINVSNNKEENIVGKKRSLASINKGIDNTNDGDDVDADDAGVPPDDSDANLYDDGYSINIWDDKYTRDPRPLQSGCTCHACRYHTRAYIHHLLKAKELLAEILLHAHNHKQYLDLFDDLQSNRNSPTIISNTSTTHI